jgi:glycosyltransferase involved in cell wall biosynthesis
MVTIIMPAYNCEMYLRSAAESVKAQTDQDWKLFIIDDCSKDNTGSVAEELATTDERIKVFHNEKNSGVAKTRNWGVKKAESEWIAFLDSDDMWEPDKLEKQINLSEEIPTAKLLFTGSGFINEHGKKIDYVLHVPDRIGRNELLKQNLVSCSSVLVKRDLMLKYPMPEKGMMHEDFASWLGILKEEKFAYGIDEPLLIYRRSENSKSGNKAKAAKMNWNTYRYVGLNPVEAAYYMCWYTMRGIMKYRHLK